MKARLKKVEETINSIIQKNKNTIIKIEIQEIIEGRRTPDDILYDEERNLFLTILETTKINLGKKNEYLNN